MRKQCAIPLIYLCVVALLLYGHLGVDPRGVISLLSLFLLLVATLPWSILTAIYVMASIHMGDDLLIIALIGISAFINSALMYLLLRSGKRDGEKNGISIFVLSPANS